MAKRAQLRFYAELNDFLPPEQRGATIEHSFALSTTVKDLIEGLGVPHTEVDLVVVNGESAALTHLVEDGDHISVFPVFESIDISGFGRVRYQPLRTTRFVVDSNLGRLARHLRLAGFDAAYRRDYDDHELAETSRREQRVLLTRDVGVLKRSVVTHGYFVRATEPRAQLVEVLRRFDLAGAMAPLTRCAHCNDTLVEVDKSDVIERLPAETARSFEEFWTCPSCGRLYWKGAHHARLAAWLEDVARGPAPEGQ